MARAPSDRAFLVFAVGALIFPLGIGLATTTNTVFASERGLGNGAIGLILSLNGVLLALFQIPIQTRIEGQGPYRLLGASAAILALSFLALGFVPGIALALTIHIVVFTMGEFLFGPTVPVSIASLAPQGLRGAYQGAWGLVWALGYGSALYLSGLVHAAWGWGATWALAAAVGFACAGWLLGARAWLHRVARERVGNPS